MSKMNRLPIGGPCLAESRIVSPTSRIKLVLGTSDVIPALYRLRVMDNPRGFLEMPYATKEMRAFKKALWALKKRRNVAAYDRLYRCVRGEIGGQAYSSPICPIARHLRTVQMLEQIVHFSEDEDTMREFVLVTTIHGFDTALSNTDEIIAEARQGFQVVRDEMFKMKNPFVEVGVFEPDLRSAEELTTKTTLRRLSSELGWDVTDSGGYVVASHRLVRVGDPGQFRRAMKTAFPGYRRVEVRKLRTGSSLWENVTRIMSYVWKFGKHVNAMEDRVPQSCPDLVRSVFGAPKLDFKRKKDFGFDEALRRWLLHLDTRGFEFFEIAYSNEFAAEWMNKDHWLNPVPTCLPPDLNTDCRSSNSLRRHPAYRSATPIQKLRMRVRHQERPERTQRPEPPRLIPKGVFEYLNRPPIDVSAGWT